MATKKETMKVPKGWVLVPKKPTQEMFDAGDDTFVSAYTGTPTTTPDKVWAAMVKAAPKPPNG